MKNVFTLIVVLATAAYFLPANAQNERNFERIKPEVCQMDYINDPVLLKSNQIKLRADNKPFPDSTITYNLVGEPIRKAFYKYNANGDQTSYLEYTKKEGTNNWQETSKIITTYNSAGKVLTGESSNWDDNKKLWIGDYKFAFTYNPTGQETSYEYYFWDSQNNIWKGNEKTTTEYINGNSRVTSYKWNVSTQSWILYERNEYISSILRYYEMWLPQYNSWSEQVKISGKKIIDSDKLDLSITLIEERWVVKDKNGKWDESNPWIYYSYSFNTDFNAGWSAWNYTGYKIANDYKGNINSVTLTAGDYIFVTTFTYDYTINKVNSFKVYDQNALLDSYIWVYDNLGRYMEIERNLNFEDRVDDFKRVYTYIGGSNSIYSIEYYLWDNSKQVFERKSKNMYTYNAEGKKVMHQTYVWADPKWEISSYTIYYPNEYTSDLIFEETEQVGSNNKGAFEGGFNLSQDAFITGSFYLTFPNGFVLDLDNTTLSDGLAQNNSMTITQQEDKNRWFFEIKEKSTRSFSAYKASSYNKILTVAYRVDEKTKRGNYPVEIKNLFFILADGTMKIEQQRNVNVTVERYALDIEPLSVDKINIFASSDYLTIESPNIESINIMNIIGNKIFYSQKAAGKFEIPIHGWQKGIYIVSSSKGWTAKVLIK